MEKETLKNTLIYALLTILIVCFILIYLYVINNNGLLDYTKIDRVVYNYVFNNLKCLEKFFLIITLFGKEVVIIGSIIFIIFSLILMKFIKIKNIKLYLINVLSPGFCALLSYGLNDIIKMTVGRYRPIGIHLTVENSYSFPSGHSVTSVVFYFLLIVILNKLFNKYIDINREKKNIAIKSFKIILNIVLGVFPFVIALSRIYIGVHYFTDVCAGLILGAILFIVYYKIYDRLTKNI